MSTPRQPAGGALRVRGVTKAFGPHPVLSGIDLEVPAGTIAAVLGPSGSGKTTLLRVVAGFELPDSGSVEIGGLLVDDCTTHVAVERRGIGYVSQEGSLFPHLDVRANVGFGLRRGGRRARSHRVDELLDLVGLEGFGDRYPHQLSGGQQQRVAIARALGPSPSLVLLDEPFASLDANLRAQVRAEVCDVLRRAATTAVLVTHDQDEALSVADVVAVLRAGVIAQVDTPADLYAHPLDADVACFVGDANLVDGTASGASVETPFGVLTSHRAFDGAGSAVTVLVRPEQLVISTSPEPKTPPAPPLDDARPLALRGVPAQISGAEYHGHDTTVWLRPLVAGLPATLVARVAGSAPPTSQAVVRVSARGPVEAWSREPAPALQSGAPGV